MCLTRYSFILVIAAQAIDTCPAMALFETHGEMH